MWGGRGAGGQGGRGAGEQGSRGAGDILPECFAHVRHKGRSIPVISYWFLAIDICRDASPLQVNVGVEKPGFCYGYQGLSVECGEETRFLGVLGFWG
ncbi:hypothetical protein AM228_01230 [Planktothricoides sp. SR001]|nr:hypothetical protein AM228_01230 [Planktothricoides sp. SR001]